MVLFLITISVASLIKPFVTYINYKNDGYILFVTFKNSDELLSILECPFQAAFLWHSQTNVTYVAVGRWWWWWGGDDDGGGDGYSGGYGGDDKTAAIIWVLDVSKALRYLLI